MPTPERRIPSVGLMPIVPLLSLLTTGTAAAQQAASVAVTRAERDSIILEVTLTGSLTSPRRAELTPEVDGRATEVIAEAGDRVETGGRPAPPARGRRPRRQGLDRPERTGRTASRCTTNRGRTGRASPLLWHCRALAAQPDRRATAGTAVVTLTFLPALTVSVLGWSERRRAARAEAETTAA